MYCAIGGMMPKTMPEVDSAVLAPIKRLGFTGECWSFEEPMEVSLEEVDRFRSTMAEGGVELVQVSAIHPDLVHPEESQRQAGIEAMQRMCLIARRAGAHLLYVRPGSLTPRGPW